MIEPVIRAFRLRVGGLRKRIPPKCTGQRDPGALVEVEGVVGVAAGGARPALNFFGIHVGRIGEHRTLRSGDGDHLRGVFFFTHGVFSPFL